MSYNSLQGRVLSVAASDSGGGAGIQADLKTITSLGAYGATAITAVTDQDTPSVHSVYPMPASLIASQIQTVLQDVGADVIKTGMLISKEVIEAVAGSIAGFGSRIPLVVDPVMVAKGGHRLLATEAVDVLVSRLIKGAAIVTPNLPEAQILVGREIRTVSDMENAVVSLRSLGSGAVLLKGGHVQGDLVVDLLITNNQVVRFESPRIKSTSTHGTGCTLASAIAAGLAQDLSLSMAIERARHYVIQAIRTAPGFGRGHGPLNHAHNVKYSVR